MVHSFFKPAKTYAGKLTSSVILFTYLLTQGCSYALSAVYLLEGSFTNSLDSRSLASLLHL